MKRGVVFEPAAAHELKERMSRLRDVSPSSSERLADDLDHLLDLVSEFPELHTKHGGTLRRAVLERWSLGVFYRSNSRFIIVAAIVDLRRDPAAIRRRLGLHESMPNFVAGPTMGAPP